MLHYMKSIRKNTVEFYNKSIISNTEILSSAYRLPSTVAMLCSGQDRPEPGLHMPCQPVSTDKLQIHNYIHKAALGSSPEAAIKYGQAFSV